MTDPVLDEVSLDEGNLLASVKAYLANVYKRLLFFHDEKKDPIGVITYRSDAIDRLLVQLYQMAERSFRSANPKNKSTSCLLSQGGYGRRELCIHSDIDILLLHDGKGQEFVQHLNERMIQILWDAGLEVGFAVRTVKDCRQLMDQDMTILTSLLDARYLVGDSNLFQEFCKMCDRYFSSKKNRDLFLQKKAVENTERRGRYGGSVYLLEPNLKEGEGGLRDYHAMHWYARVFDRINEPRDLVLRGYLTEEEFASLWEALKFIWNLRNELHRRAGRRSDQLVVEYQEPIAHWFGYMNTDQFFGVELFMQQYYRNASIVHTLSEKAMRRSSRRNAELFPLPVVPLEDQNLRVMEGRLTVASPDLFDREPLYLLKIFDISRKLEVEIDDIACERIKKSLCRIDDTFRSSAEAGALFRDILSRPVGLSRLLGQMNDLQVLGAFLPEFGKLNFRVQHDLYHVYTVDIHSIFAVAELGKLVEGEYVKAHPTLTRIMQDMNEKKDPRHMAVLAFSILYHDIGKGEGRGHVEKGAPIIRASGARLGFSKAEQESLEFLERSHLIMTHVAFRRDLEEQNMIIQFAKAMQSLDLLDMLYVLTFCDVKGVSSEAMTDWKASLLEYLYLKTRVVIQKGAFTKEQASTLVPKVLEETLGLLESQEDRDKCREFFGIMTPRYLLSTPPAMIIRHVVLWERFVETPVFEWRVIEKEGLNEVTLFTWENPAMFSRMTGLFAAHNINIIEAQLNLSNRGHALQVFKVTDAEGHPIQDEDKWIRVERDLRDVLEQRVPIETLVAEKFKPSIFKKKVARIVPSEVEIDNDVSPFYTVIDVFAHDRVGFLYQITSTLSALGLYVDVSKISTKVDQVADTFYVKDIFGHKITSQERLKKIKEALLKVLEEEPTPGWRPPKF